MWGLRTRSLGLRTRSEGSRMRSEGSKTRSGDLITMSVDSRPRIKAPKPCNQYLIFKITENTIKFRAKVHGDIFVQNCIFYII